MFDLPGLSGLSSLPMLAQLPIDLNKTLQSAAQADRVAAGKSTVPTTGNNLADYGAGAVHGAINILGTTLGNILTIGLGLILIFVALNQLTSGAAVAGIQDGIRQVRDEL